MATSEQENDLPRYRIMPMFSQQDLVISARNQIISTKKQDRRAANGPRCLQIGIGVYAGFFPLPLLCELSITPLNIVGQSVQPLVLSSGARSLNCPAFNQFLELGTLK
jgi:hypothetical protein